MSISCTVWHTNQRRYSWATGHLKWKKWRPFAVYNKSEAATNKEIICQEKHCFDRCASNSQVSAVNLCMNHVHLSWININTCGSTKCIPYAVEVGGMVFCFIMQNNHSSMTQSILICSGREAKPPNCCRKWIVMFFMLGPYMVQRWNVV